MSIRLTAAAEAALRERLALQPEGTRVRVLTYGTGCLCKPQHTEAQLSFDTLYSEQEDELFEVCGLPFVMKKNASCACSSELRVGLAGLPR
ncbi:hypothetical protein [Mailhella sp.]|uniref:hypothetical protein n=1 Tax=Mailhella sp. TaxID=1981029 RepID=UPI0040636100